MKQSILGYDGVTVFSWDPDRDEPAPNLLQIMSEAHQLPDWDPWARPHDKCLEVYLPGKGVHHLCKEQPEDKSDCAYYRERGICTYGCTEEPSCICDEPEEGWPGRFRTTPVELPFEG